MTSCIDASAIFARTATDNSSADLFARGKTQAVERAVAGVSLDVAVILSVGKSIDGDVLAGRRLALRISLLIKVIFFDGCVFHCPCASVEKIFCFFRRNNRRGRQWDVGTRRLFR